MDLELCKTQSPLQLLHITSPVEVGSKIYEDATSKMLVRLAQTPGFSKGPLYVSNPKTVQYSKADMLYGYFGEEAWSLCTCPYSHSQFAPAAPKLELFVLIFLQSTELRAGTTTAMSSGPTRRFSAHTAID